MPDPAILLNPADQPTDPSLQQANLVPDEKGGNPDPFGLSLENPLSPIVAIWRNKLKLAAKYKEQQFGKWAREGMRFLIGPYDFIYGSEYATSNPFFKFTPSSDETDAPAPTFQMSLNLVAEMVDIFGPILYHRNPNRKVLPRDDINLPPLGLLGAMVTSDPNEQQALAEQEQQMQQVVGQQDARDRAVAGLMEWLLNYTPAKLDLKRHARRAIDECIVAGMGCLWVEVYQPKGANFKMIGSFFDPVRNLLIDPDAEALEDAMWISRTKVEPVWKVERDRGYPPGTLKANIESYGQQAAVTADEDGDYRRKTGQTADLMRYTCIWSKMGIGGRLKEAPEELKKTLESFGDYCYLEVAEGVPFPLNFGPKAQSQPLDMNGQTPLDWPTPFWVADMWPFVPFQFHEISGQIWPRSILRSALGELVFLNWCFSFLAGKVRNTCRDFLAIKKAAGEEIVDTIIHGKDLSLIRMDQALGGSIQEIVQFLQHPSISGDIYKLIEMVQHNFEKRTGLSELMYGMTPTQMRSAEEANLKGSQTQIRPDDMSAKVEEAMSDVALLEAIASHWHLKKADIEPIMGKVHALYWERLVSTMDLHTLAHSLQYRIEAGSAKKPNKERDAQNISQAMQNLLQPLFEAAMQKGDVGPFNTLLADWAKSVGLDAKGYMLQPPPPQPSPEEIAAQQAAQEQQQSAQQHEQDLQHAQQAHGQKMQHQAQAHAMKQQMTAQQQAQAQEQAEGERAQSQAQEQAENEQAASGAHQEAVARLLEMARTEAEHRQKLRHTHEAHKSKLKQQEEAAKLKPNPISRSPKK